MNQQEIGVVSMSSSTVVVGINEGGRISECGFCLWRRGWVKGSGATSSASPNDTTDLLHETGFASELLRSIAAVVTVAKLRAGVAH